MNILAIFENKILIAVLIAWLLAQVLKIPTEYLRSRRWMWAMVRERLDQMFRNAPGVSAISDRLEDAVRAGQVPASLAADRLLAAFETRD